jgi:preprotein translocase subunit SecA
MAWLLLSNSHSPTGRLISKTRFLQFGLKDGEELEHAWLTTSGETAQKWVEQRNYLISSANARVDDVMNQQREVIYGYCQEVMDSENPRELVFEVIDEMVPKKVVIFR